MNLMSMFKLFFNPIALIQQWFTLWGGGGGSDTTATTYTSSLPQYAEPYYNQLLKSAGKAVFTTSPTGAVTGVKPYVAYTGERVAGFTPEQLAVQNQILGMQTPGDYSTSQAGLTDVADIAKTRGLAGLTTALGYEPGQITPQMVGAQEFTGADAAKYMSPYAQNVIDINKREAQRAADIKRAAGAMGAINRGTFGGARQALAQAEEDRGTAQLLSDIQQKGTQAAYENAQAMFEKDQARKMQAAQLNQATDLKAEELMQQAEQFKATTGKDIGLAGLSQQLEAAKAKAAVAAQQATTELEQLKAKAATAEEKQALQQQIDDIKYQTFMEAKNYERSLIEYYSNILHGTAGALGSTQVQYNPAPSVASQVGGLGLAGLGLYNVLGGNKG